MHLSRRAKNDAIISVTSTQVLQDGESFTVYGIYAHTADGKEYRCDDISCNENEVKDLVERLRSASFTFEELPYLVEDYVDAISEYKPMPCI